MFLLLGQNFYYMNNDGGYKIRNQEAIHFITFAVVEWVDVYHDNLFL